jgi:hypothetical protein
VFLLVLRLPHHQVSPFKFVFILYFLMCGGPFGLEEVVGLAYPLISLALIVVIPLIYTFPLSLIVSELGTALPTNEGTERLDTLLTKR